jgi:hypothetical protein
LTLTLLATILLLAAPAWAGRTTADYDPDADFAGYRTYAWKDGTPAKSDLMHKRIVSAIESQLESLGMTESDGDPDVYVLYHVALSEERRIDVDEFGYTRRWRYPVATTVDVYDVKIGTLIVDLLDGTSEEGVWRGFAERELSGNPTPQKVEKKLRKILLKMFRNYPPE